MEGCIHKLSLDTKSLPFVVELFLQEPCGLFQVKNSNQRCVMLTISASREKKKLNLSLCNTASAKPLCFAWIVFWTSYCTQTDLSPPFPTSMLPLTRNWIVLSPQRVAPATRGRPSLSWSPDGRRPSPTLATFRENRLIRCCR